MAGLVVARVDERHLSLRDRHHRHADHAVFHDVDAARLETVGDRLPPQKRDGDDRDGSNDKQGKHEADDFEEDHHR